MFTWQTPDWTPHWSIEGKIEVVHEGAADLHRTHVGIKVLSQLLAQHEGKWAKVRVELIDGPRPTCERCGAVLGDGQRIACDACLAASGIDPAEFRARGSKVADELKRMRFLATEIRERMATIRAVRMPPGASHYVTTAEEDCIDTLAEAMLVVCDQIEGLDRRLRSLEGR